MLSPPFELHFTSPRISPSQVKQLSFSTSAKHLDEENCSPNMNLKVIIGVVAALAAVTLGVQQNQQQGFRATFMKRCEEFKGKKPPCKEISKLFEQAYVGKDDCSVPVTTYNPLMKAVPFTHPCGKSMFWSKTAKVVHEYTKKNKDCFAMEDTLLGYCLDGQTWCGKKGSSETFTSGCPKWDKCVKNPVRSFWTRASEVFADHACDEVTVMLDGAQQKAFDPTSVFATIEIKRFKFPKVKKLNVILVSAKGFNTNCKSPNISCALRKALDLKVKYLCREIPISQIEKCNPSQNRGCAPCLLTNN